MNDAGNPRQTIGIVGGGFVGITLAGYLLQNPNISLHIFEQNHSKLEQFKVGNYQVFEPELKEILDYSRSVGKLFFNDESLEKVDCLFIAVGTPKGMSSEEQLSSFDSIISNLETRIKRRGFIFLRSTVVLGTTEKLAARISESSRSDLSVFFAPERTAEGKAIQELRDLPQVVGGAKDSRPDGIEFLQNIGFRTLECSNSTTAELIKLACNTWRDTTFAYANELANIADFERIDVREVIELANLDYSRGGIPRPGPVGGPCLSKDSHILLSNQPYAATSMILAGRLVNESIFEKLVNYLLHQADENVNLLVEILGAAFKGRPFTNDVRDGVADIIISNQQIIQKGNIQFWITDETLLEGDLIGLRENWHQNQHPAHPNVLVIGNDGEWISSPENISYLRGLPPQVTIIDLWGVTRDISDIKAKIKLFGSGDFL
jgi:UDP-N-acetyl-D-mannosaminuronic acid dehydrogenase